MEVLLEEALMVLLFFTKLVPLTFCTALVVLTPLGFYVLLSWTVALLEVVLFFCTFYYTLGYFSTYFSTF